ncbi:MAG: hypothetical protein H6513_12855 [Acidimicrobiaceae bacterium]|nr:hypothetical protein [Acidimicrobiaceae bacterium]
MTDHDPTDPTATGLDRMLSDAFSGVRAGGRRPSISDVQRRARRHLHRRRAGLAVGAVALVGAGGAALAARDGSTGTTAPAGAGDLDDPQATATFPATTTTCVVYVDTTTTDVRPSDQGLSPTSTLLCGEVITDDQGQYRCEGEGRVGDDGYTYYDYCEQVWPWADVTTTIIWPEATTTSVEYPPATDPGLSPSSTVPGSYNGNTDTTSPALLPSSTTSAP